MHFRTFTHNSIMIKAAAVLSGLLGVLGNITENSYISLGCAAAVVVIVFKAGSELRFIRDKLEQHDQKFDSQKSASMMDIDALRAELRPVMKEASPLLAPWKPASTQRYRVLILEDNVQDLFMFRRMLANAFDVDDASTLAGGCEKLQNGSYDCVLLDLGLPDLSRDTAVIKFLVKHPSALCIAMSGAEGMESVALKQGADAFIAKDAMLEPAYLQRMINHAIVRFKSRTNI